MWLFLWTWLSWTLHCRWWSCRVTAVMKEGACGREEVVGARLEVYRFNKFSYRTVIVACLLHHRLFLDICINTIIYMIVAAYFTVSNNHPSDRPKQSNTYSIYKSVHSMHYLFIFDPWNSMQSCGDSWSRRLSRILNSQLSGYQVNTDRLFHCFSPWLSGLFSETSHNLANTIYILSQQYKYKWYLESNMWWN